MMQWRNIQEDNKQTTIALESHTWILIDRLARNRWQDWVGKALETRPPGTTKSHWLRNVVLAECCRIVSPPLGRH